MRRQPAFILVAAVVGGVVYGSRRGFEVVSALMIVGVVLVAMAVWHRQRSRRAGDSNSWDRRFDVELDLPVSVEVASRAVERALSSHAKFVVRGNDGDFRARTAETRWNPAVWPVFIRVAAHNAGSRVKLEICYEDGLFDFGGCARKLRKIRDAVAAESRRAV